MKFLTFIVLIFLIPFLYAGAEDSIKEVTPVENSTSRIIESQSKVSLKSFTVINHQTLTLKEITSKEKNLITIVSNNKDTIKK